MKFCYLIGFPTANEKLRHLLKLTKHTAEVLLYMLLPEEELKSRIVVTILVEIGLVKSLMTPNDNGFMTSFDLGKVTNAIIMPFIDMAVSADYLNQMTCWWFEDLCSDIGYGS